jgi:hypothetical protein
MELKMIQCLQQRVFSAHHAQRESKIWLVSELIIHHGITSHSRHQIWECLNRDKVSQKCIPNRSMKVHIMVVMRKCNKLIRVLKTLMNQMEIGNKCSVRVKNQGWGHKESLEEVVQEGEESDQWRQRWIKTQRT